MQPCRLLHVTKGYGSPELPRARLTPLFVTAGSGYLLATRDATCVTDQVNYCLKTNGGPLTLLTLRINRHLDAIGNLMKGMPLFIPHSLRIESHCPCNLTRACPLAGKREV